MSLAEHSYPVRNVPAWAGTAGSATLICWQGRGASREVRGENGEDPRANCSSLRKQPFGHQTRGPGETWQVPKHSVKLYCPFFSHPHYYLIRESFSISSDLCHVHEVRSPNPSRSKRAFFCSLLSASLSQPALCSQPARQLRASCREGSLCVQAQG